MEEWLKNAAAYFVKEWGIDAQHAQKFALLYAYLASYGLNPRPTSGYRSQSYQDSLRARWDRGDRAGLKYRPAAKSRHTTRRAMDISTSDEKLAAQIAKAIGMKAGYDYGDPVHFEA